MTRIGKIIASIVVLIIIGGIALFAYQRNQRAVSVPLVPETISVVYTNTDGTTVPATFNNAVGTVTVTTPKTGTVLLKQAVSASGARYVNQDESIVLWDKGGEVTIEYNSEVIYAGTVDDAQTVVSDTLVEQIPVVMPEVETIVDTESEGNYPAVNETDATENAPETIPNADPNIRELLVNNAWVWEKTLMNDDTVIAPNTVGDFVITFTNDGRVQGDTDCNNFGGSFTVDGTAISFGPLMSTLMYCEGSQETQFLKYFNEVDHVFFDAAGNLVLLIKYDSGSIMFKKQ